jgi:hypothetical protein
MIGFCVSPKDNLTLDPSPLRKREDGTVNGKRVS